MSAAGTASRHEKLTQQPKPVTDKTGHTYKSLTEKMKYIMRRRRDSDLPHYPTHEPENS